MLDQMQTENDSRQHEPFFSAFAAQNTVYKAYPPLTWKEKLYDIFPRSDLGVGSVALSFFLMNYDLFMTLPLWVGLPINFLSGYVAYNFLTFNMRIETKESFLQANKHVPPPTDPHPFFKDRTTQTFNHLFSFIKKHNLIWYAPRINDVPNWKILYLRNISKEAIARSEMIADGQNLMLRVPKGDHFVIYYKKIIKEAFKDNRYIVTGLCEVPENNGSWFSLPFFNYFKPKLWYRPLALAQDSLWAMSNSDTYKKYIEDSRGRQHVNWGATTVYELNNRTIRLHDPYVEEGSEFTINIPEDIEPVWIDASASFLVILGHDKFLEYNPLIFYMRYLDYDSLPLNPLIPYTHDKNQFNKRLLPLSKWRKGFLPQPHGNASICCVQCGQGNDAIEIRITYENLPGFYFKKLNDENWKHSLNDEIDIHMEKPKRHLPYQYCAYPKNGIEIDGIKFLQVDMQFNPLADFNKVQFKDNKGKTSHLLLFRSKAMIKSFIGLASESWYLAPNPKYPTSFLFKNSQTMTIPVDFRFSEQTLFLDFKGISFTFFKEAKHRQNLLLNYWDVANSNPAEKTQEYTRSTSTVKLGKQ